MGDLCLPLSALASCAVVPLRPWFADDDDEVEVDDVEVGDGPFFFLGEKDGGSGKERGSKSDELMLIEEQNVCAEDGDRVLRRLWRDMVWGGGRRMGGHDRGRGCWPWG